MNDSTYGRFSGKMSSLGNYIVSLRRTCTSTGDMPLHLAAKGQSIVYREGRVNGHVFGHHDTYILLEVR